MALGMDPSRLVHDAAHARTSGQALAQRPDVLMVVGHVSRRQSMLGCTGCGRPFLEAHEELGLVMREKLNVSWDVIPNGRKLDVVVHVLCLRCRIGGL